jgi:putative hydroxymethylpyrimidine transport system substrate-binding protein
VVTRAAWTALVAVVALGLAAGFPAGAAAPAPVTFMLDWFPNPDHVPLYAAIGEGYFTQAGLRIDLEVPANPDDPLKLTAVGRADVAVNYEPSVIMARAQGLPVRSIGLLVGQPLTTIMFLKSSGIRTPRDLVGRRVGFSVTGLEDAILDQVMRSVGSSEADVRMINVGFDLVPALLTHKVDAVVGAYRNVERVQIEMQGQAVGMFEPERYGVPEFYELVLIANDRTVATRRPLLRRFVQAVARGVAFTESHPEEAFQQYVRLNARQNPKIGDAFNRRSFEASLPYYARTQRQSRARWEALDTWLAAHQVIARPVPVDRLYTNVVP